MKSYEDGAVEGRLVLEADVGSEKLQVLRTETSRYWIVLLDRCPDGWAVGEVFPSPGHGKPLTGRGELRRILRDQLERLAQGIG